MAKYSQPLKYSLELFFWNITIKIKIFKAHMKHYDAEESFIIGTITST